MASTKYILGMRDRFFEKLFEIAKKDRNVCVVSADNGAPSLDQFSFELDKQFITVGIAEQQMQGFAAGLASEGKKVYTYAIAPFVTTRIFEQNKLDQCAMNLPIVNVGIGAGYSYSIMGPSHHTVEDISIMRSLPNMKIFSPADGVTAEAYAELSYKDPSPQYVRFDRAGIPDLYNAFDFCIEDGLVEVRKGERVCIVAIGIMVHEALKAADLLKKKFGHDVGVIDLFRVKPINWPMLKRLLTPYQQIVTYEEHLLHGGMGSAVGEHFIDDNFHRPILRIGQNDRFVFDNGGREVIWKKYGMDYETLVTRVAAALTATGRVNKPFREMESVSLN